MSGGNARGDNEFGSRLWVSGGVLNTGDDDVWIKALGEGGGGAGCWG